MSTGDTSSVGVANVATPTNAVENIQTGVLDGLPFTPVAGHVVPITWDDGSNKIFKL